MRARERVFVLVLALCGGSFGAACGDAGSDATGGVGGDAAGGAAPTCEFRIDAATVHLAASTLVGVGEEATVCLRWTAPEDLEVSGILGTLGALGHHALLLTQENPTEPDGLAPCSEAELMDASAIGSFQMLAGVSYESSGVRYDFPEYSGYQVGLEVPKGTQLVFDAHFLNSSGAAELGCATLELAIDEPVAVPLQFRTVLPAAEYMLAVPANGTQSIDVSEPAGAAYRIAAASSHMHAGATYFRLSIAETDQTLYETTTWSDPVPALFDTQQVTVEANQTFRLECSFENTGPTVQRFPEQMCVGGMYLLPCTFPGAC